MRPISVLSSEQKFEGKILSVRVDTVDLGQGRPVSREVVEHRSAVCILPVGRDGTVYLVRQYRHAVGMQMLEAPAGLIEDGETPEQAAARELREETGASGILTPLGDFYPTPGYCTERIFLFFAQVDSFGDPDPDEDEYLQVERIPFEVFYGQACDGTLSDGKTVAAALRAENCLKIVERSRNHVEKG